MDRVSHAKQRYVRGNGEEEFQNLVRNYDELCRDIRTLNNLPLSVNNIHAIDSSVRHTQVSLKLYWDYSKEDTIDEKFPVLREAIVRNLAYLGAQRDSTISVFIYSFVCDLNFFVNLLNSP